MKARHQPQSGEEWRKPFWRQRSWIIAAGFLLLICFTAVINMISSPGDPDTGGETAADAAPTRSASASGAGDNAAENGEDGDCPRQQSGEEPAAVPADLAWEDVGGAFLPTSSTSGPLRRTDDGWSCFGHTPTGAVLAAHVIPSQMSGPRWREVARTQLVPGSGQREFIAARATVSDAEAGASPGELGTYDGFNVLDYTADRATVQLLVRRPDGAYVATSVAVSWQSGDWKLAPQSDGALTSAFVAVSGTTGFVVWED
ncbi:hypothetical protein SAMN04487983_102178 [Streptomyces sp. yr375]|uniref:hypothetical protein n=1 Tax=Streptomyces sp. yr375 TaxID=1761906 RepID=UPI0008BAFDF2|nr:hypothetical protein [Streptomyces sp. yr375]SER74582.1 hypothetical protein SAMN04487983_102178 [Streptomyces sp. yr375]